MILRTCSLKFFDRRNEQWISISSPKDIKQRVSYLQNFMYNK